MAGLAAGLLLWAPWRSAPVLQPTGLQAGSATLSSVRFTWSKPATGPLPDRYVILHDGKVIGSVGGTVTAYLATGLHYGTSYKYQVAAVRGGTRSAASRFVRVTTATPPVSAARFAGTSPVSITENGAFLGGPGTSLTPRWTASPDCPAGPCAVRLSGDVNGQHFAVTLTRAGAVYTGTAKSNLYACPSAPPDQGKLTFRITVTGGRMAGPVWEAGSWHGTLLIYDPPYNGPTSGCAPFRVTASISAPASGPLG